MPELKRNFIQGRMNKDLDERLVPSGEYRDALNVEVNTSEGANVGTVQTLKGNTLLLTEQLNDTSNLTADNHLFSKNAVCVGSIANQAENKIYWFVTDPSRNYDASWRTDASSYNDTYVHTDVEDIDISITHKVYSDYIIEYNEITKKACYVAVEHVKIITKTSNANHGDANHLHISNLGTTGDIRHVGVQVGMEVYVDGMKTSVIKIEEDTDSGYNGWRIYTKHDKNDLGYADLASVTAGTKVTFKLPHEKRALAFNHFAYKYPGEVITGINIIDDMLFWTDNLTEPKKINIPRCKYGSQQGSPSTYEYGTRKYPTLLMVNGTQPDEDNGRLAPSATYPSAIKYPFLSYQYTTVIKKSPTVAPKLIMSNTNKSDIEPKDGNVLVEYDVTLPFSNPPVASSDFFFMPDGTRMPHGEITDSLSFPQNLDWEENDTIEFYPENDEAGFDGSALVTAFVETKTGGNIFTFRILSISETLVKTFVNFRVRLQEKDPLFEFKFPRFAYRWKYEDGEYSAYSPFTEPAFIPDRFDYHPKKGFNLGMTNNLRYLLIYGFKPITMPLDVVEIDILYKESNSPNVYTVETIKSPSEKARVGSKYRNDTVDYEGDLAWFGKINKHDESPNTLSTAEQLVAASSFTGVVAISNGVYYFSITEDLNKVNIKVGDKLVFTDGQTGLTSDILVADFSTTNIGYISLTANGTAVTSTSSTWLYEDSTFEVYRNIAKKPAFNIDDPIGSLEIKSDMIHAALPANQLLRPWDNVPRKALGQEVTGNRIVYANYIQNYDLVGGDENNIVKPKFQVEISKRKNIRESIQFDENTSLIHPINGTTIKWYDALNALTPSTPLPEKSIKSLRTYQIGMVWIDEYGRQTPIQTDKSGSIKVKKSKADDYNNITLKVTERDWPSWATHYRYFIKETSNEYYNLALDRFYDAKDGNIWLSFPSSERNKVDIDTYLILKKQHDNDTFVNEKARYRILAIENEAPLYVRTKFDSFGIISTSNFGGGQPKVDQSHIDVPANYFDGDGPFSGALNATDRVVRVSGHGSFSNWYDIANINEYGSYRRITVKRPFKTDMSFTTDDGTNTGTLKTGLSVELATQKEKNLPEFNGRFFVKIHKDSVLQKHILSNAPDKIYIMEDFYDLGYQRNVNDEARFYSDASTWFYNDTTSDVPGSKFFVSEIDHHWEGYSGELAPGGTRSNQPWVSSDDSWSTIDIQMHWGSEGKIAKGHRFGITKRGNSFKASSKDLAIAQKFRNPGQLFRWKGDTTVYKVRTKGYEWMAENYNNSKWASNHSVMIRMEFEPPLGSMDGIIVNGVATGEDAVGNTPTGYNPFESNAEGFTAGSTTYEEGEVAPQHWVNDIRAVSEKYKVERQIQFLTELVSDETYSSDNPAIFETEPKEDIDLDIYYEASDSLAIESEWSPYKNRFDDVTNYNYWNPLQYYNCFSFANGVESNRVRDDFNAVTIDKGPKVSTVLAEQFQEERRKSGLIYSGIYNNMSGVNNLNQFIMAEKITKDLNPTYGSIQKLWSKDTNLTAFCEDRVINILANKDALFNADGNANVTATNRVLGNAKPYGGDYGISNNPSSFASDEYRAYFTDKARGAVLRLSAQGLTPISDTGMKDYFKDAFRAKDIVLLGSYDDNKDIYNLTIKHKNQEGLSGVNDEDDATSDLLWNGTPTQGNFVGIWFRYGAIVDYRWAAWLETKGNSANAYNQTTTSSGSTAYIPYTTGLAPDINNAAASQVVGSVNVTTRGWTGIATGQLFPYTTDPVLGIGSISTAGIDNYYPSHTLESNWCGGGATLYYDKRGDKIFPVGLSQSDYIFSTGTAGVTYKAGGGYGANPKPENGVTVWFNRITSGYAFEPAFDSKPNWDAIINALNVHGPNNVYLYQNNLFEGQYPANMGGGTPMTPTEATQWITTYGHAAETCWSIETVSYDPVHEYYEVKLNWIHGMAGYSDVNHFVWSLNGPFSVVDEDINIDAANGFGSDNAGLVNITASFSEQSKGWTTFQSWLKESGLSVNDKYFTFRGGDIYQHNNNEIRNNFYGTQYHSSICVLFNDIPSSVKSFSSLSYEGTQSRVLMNTTDGQYYNNSNVDGWYSSYIETDLETGFIPEFKKKEGKWFNYIKGDKSNNLTNLNTQQFSTQGIGRLSTISSVVSSDDNTGTTTPGVANKITIQDTGDTD